jgi:hypothetical protein
VLHVELVPAREILEDEVDEEVHLPHHPVARLHLGQHDDLGLEPFDRIDRLAFEANPHEDIETAPDPIGVQQGDVPVDEPGLLEAPHPPQARRRRQPHPVRQLLVGDPPLLLEDTHDVAVDLVRLEHVDTLTQSTASYGGR